MKIIKDAVVPAQTGAAFELRAGQYLKVIDMQGKQVSDLFCFNRNDRSEWLSSGRSIDYADTIYLTRDHFLYSNRSRKMLHIVDDSCGQHDFLLTPCSLAMFQIVADNKEWHPSCHENLSQNFARYDISPDQISTTFNIFMNVVVAASGEIEIKSPVSEPGDSILFCAEMDLLVGLTACSHEGTNAGQCKPVQYQILEPD
jgi:uncharacterized protein